MREARFAQNRRQRAPWASVRPGPTRPRPLAPRAVHYRVAAGSAGAHALPELAVTAAAHKSHTPGKGGWSSPGKSGGPLPGNQVVLTSGNQVGPIGGNHVVLNRGNRVGPNRGNFALRSVSSESAPALARAAYPNRPRAPAHRRAPPDGGRTPRSAVQRTRPGDRTTGWRVSAAAPCR